MRTLSFFTIMVIIFSTANIHQLAAQAVHIGLFQKAPDSLEVRLLPDHSFDGIVSNVQFTIRWDSASGASLGAINQPFPQIGYIPMQKSGLETDDNGFRYQVFFGSGTFPMFQFGAEFTPCVEIVLFTIPVLFDNSNFAIVNDSWTAHPWRNGNYYVALNGQDRTGGIYNNEIQCRINQIKGQVFFDFNGNGLVDSLDGPMANQKIEILPGPSVHYTNGSGRYHAYVIDSGSYTVAIVPPQNFALSSSPASYTINFTGSDSISDGNDFMLTPTSIINDVRVTVTGSIARPGWLNMQWIHYENVGTFIMSGSINYVYDSILAFSNASPSAVSDTNNQMTWNYADLYPGEQRSILMFFQIPPDGNLIGDTLDGSVVISPQDDNNINNSDKLVSAIVGSFDPNDKLIAPDDLKDHLPPDQPIYYTIRFQNTGNDTAFKVVIKDTLESNLDASTLKTIASSHEPGMQLESGKYITWTFDNILLPDSNVNEAESHGFVKFSINPVPGIAAGTYIENSASIYFDYNDPVKTNTVVGRIEINTGIEEVGSESLSVYPNPTSGMARVQLSQHFDRFELEVLDLSGKVMLTYKELTGDHVEINTGSLQNGIYIIRAKEDAKVISMGKLVVLK